jgi:FMN reductase (NADPH)/FMN reductase [NAD(P)H]
MNQTLALLFKRKSVRAYKTKAISKEIKASILAATLRAPTAGNMMLYSIIEVRDQDTKNRLVKTCDNQPFIAKAPLVLMFLADYQRWYDYFHVSGVEQRCEQKGLEMRKPKEGDLFLACCDALIAAQTAVIASESLGIGSCYIGDIMENYETHKALFDLPKYVFPITLVCFGYPTTQQQERALTQRFDEKYIFFEDRYKRFEKETFEDMFRERQAQMFGKKKELKGALDVGQAMYQRKFDAGFAHEMNRSVQAMLRAWGTD